jgi:peptidoglycan/xylan/chitin deacetylase (PgdA/CDA1 family)
MTTSQKIRAKLRREFAYLRRDISYLFDKSFYENARGSRIVIYHGICLRDHTRFNPIFLKLKTFERHLQFYKRHFNVVSLDDYYNKRFSKDKFNICLTFDDGYANNHKYVLSLVDKYQLPVTFFVTAIGDTGYDILWNDFMGIVGKYGPKTLVLKNEHFHKGRFNKYISEQSGKGIIEILRAGDFDIKAETMKLLYPLVPFRESKPYDIDYWLQMNQQQIRDLSLSPYATIGSHGYYHNDLSRISHDAAVAEMKLSKQYLENIIDKPVNSLAFPYGTYTPAVVDAAKNIGYDKLLCMDFHFEEDHADTTMRERFTVNPFINTPGQMHATVTKSYER